MRSSWQRFREWSQDHPGIAALAIMALNLVAHVAIYAAIFGIPSAGNSAFGD